MTDIFPVIETNPWLQAALALTLLVIVPGLAWSWLVPLDSLREPWRRKLVLPALALVTGLACSTLAALALAETGRLTVVNLTGLLAVISLAGFCAGRKNLPLILRNTRDLFPGALALLSGFVLVMLLPNRGEWIVGGWDPGVYINQGVNVARTGTFHTPPLPWHAFMTAEDWMLFTRGGTEYREIAPGIPITIATGTVEPYFFRLFPSLVAMLDLCGGLRAATRASDFMAVASLLAFAGLLASWTRSVLAVLASLALLAIQPLWLYQSHIPTTEMFHLVLLCGVGLLLPHRHGKTSALVGVLIFAIVLNRFDFAAFSALLLVVVAVLDFPRDDRRGVMREHACLLAGVAAGYIADLLLSSVTLLRLDFALPKLCLAMLIFVAASFAIDITARNARLRELILRPQNLWRFAAVAAVPAAIALVIIVQKIAAPSGLTPSFTKLLPFVTAPLLITAAAGLAVWLVPGSVTREEKLFVLYLVAITLALFIEGGIIPTYPWSTRRFITCLVPALALLGGTAIAAIAATRHRLANLAIAAALILVIAFIIRQPARQALRATEYDGASHALAQVAAQINPGDIVIADHHWWSTPLTFIYNRPALDGNFLLAPGATNAVPRALEAARRWHAAGKQIVFLTSTREGLGIYKTPITNTVTEWTSAPVQLREVIHSKTARTIETKTRTFTFQLHRLQPD